MKTENYYLIFILCLAFVSCKKDQVKPDEIITDNSHFEGNFLCDVDYDYSHWGTNENRNYDKVIHSRVENDSLKVLAYAFPIVYSTQTEFRIDSFGTSSYVTVEFSANYEEISIYVYSPGVLAGPSRTSSYSGFTTSLLETTDPNPYLNDLEGTYNLDVTYRNYNNGIDTQYVMNVPVSMTNNQIAIGSEYFSFGGAFHSYSNEVIHDFQDYEKTVNSITWNEDSLSIDYLLTTGLSLSVPIDTIHYTFNGTK